MKTKNIFRMLLVAVALLLGANNVKADDYQYEGEVFTNLTSTSTIRVNCSVTNINYWQITFATINDQTPEFADWHGGTDWGAAWYYTKNNHAGYFINDSYFDLKCDQSTVNKLKNNGLKISTQGLTVTGISIDGSSASGGGNISTTDVTVWTGSVWSGKWAENGSRVFLDNGAFSSLKCDGEDIIRVYGTLGSIGVDDWGNAWFIQFLGGNWQPQGGWDCLNRSGNTNDFTGYVDFEVTSDVASILKNNTYSSDGKCAILQGHNITFTSIVVNPSNTNATTPTLTFPQLRYDVTFGTQFDAPTATCSVDGLTISYNSNNPDVAEVASNGAVTIKAAGRATITASTPATGVYNAATASYQLFVSKANVELSYSPQEVTATLGEAWTMPTLSNPLHVAVTYSSTNQNVATIDANGNVTLVGTGETLIKANYAGDNNHYAKEASYKLTVKGATEIPEYISVNMGNYECRTYVTTTYIDFSQSVGIKGYYAAGLNNEGTAVQFTKVTGVVPPHVPLLLQKISGAFEYKLRISNTENATAPSPNKLNAGSSSIFNSGIWGSSIYVLTVHNNQLVFAEVSDVNKKAHVDEEHAYLDLNNSNAHARLTISFDDNNNGATGIDAIESNEESREVIYDLHGQRVQNPTKGVYIINGKKMVIK